jgi:hypothetical protein
MATNFHSIFPVATAKAVAGEKDLQGAQRETLTTAVAVSLAVLIVALVAVLMGMA